MSDTTLPNAHQLAGDVDPVSWLTATHERVGAPVLYARATRTTWPREGASLAEHLVVDLLSTDVHAEFDETREIGIPGITGKVVQRTSTRFLKRATMTQAIWSAIRAIDATKLLRQQDWIESDGLWPAGDSWSYFIDSTCEWSAWGLVGTSGTPMITSRGRVRSSESTLDDALELVGIPDQTASFLPCAAFRYRQDLIRIERSRIESGPIEKLRVFFKLGLLGGTYVQGNAPRLQYELRDQDRRSHTMGEVVLDADRIRDGVLIDATEGSKTAPIYSARLVLLLNGSAVDVSDAAYIRSISVRIGHPR